MLGTCFKESFIALLEQTPITTKILDCEDATLLPVFHESTYDSRMTDLLSFVYFIDENSTVTSLELLKDGEVVDTLTYSTSILNQFNQYIITYSSSWRDVYNEFGNGKYQIKIVVNPLFGSDITDYSFEYNLMPYSDSLADKTIRFDYYNSNVKEWRGLKVDYNPLTWQSQIRIPNSFFGFEKANYEREQIRWQSGVREWIKDERLDNYICEITNIDINVSNEIKEGILQSDDIYINDYNLSNVNSVIDKSVVCNSNYEPEYNLDNKIVSVSLTFEEKKQLGVKHRQ